MNMIICEELLTPQEVQMTFFMGGLIIIMCTIVFVMPIVLIAILIYKSARKKRKEDYMISMRGIEIDEKRLDMEREKNVAKKIVKCEYCGKQSKFGNGTCEYCGGSLKL